MTQSSKTLTQRGHLPIAATMVQIKAEATRTNITVSIVDFPLVVVLFSDGRFSSQWRVCGGSLIHHYRADVSRLFVLGLGSSSLADILVLYRLVLLPQPLNAGYANAGDGLRDSLFACI